MSADALIPLLMSLHVNSKYVNSGTLGATHHDWYGACRCSLGADAVQ